MVMSKFKCSVLEVRGRILLIVRVLSSPLDFVVQFAVEYTRRQYFFDFPFQFAINFPGFWFRVNLTRQWIIRVLS
jgi:hypothetical protein